MRVLTLNLRHDVDRWPDRLPLVVRLIAGARADVVALQEVALTIGQDRVLADALRDLGPAYAVHTAPKWGDQNAEGVSLLTRLPARDHEVLALPGDGGRVAQRVVLRLRDGSDVTVANTHLHHLPLDDETVREPQARAILDWLGGGERSLLVGDLNADPGSATLEVFRDGFTSALPAGTPTFPTALSTEGFAPTQIDHVLVGRGLRVTSAEVVGDDPHPDDPHLAPSDHAGVLAAVALEA